MQRFGWHKSSQESLRETIECMPEDDDMNYPMLNLMVRRKYGPEFAPWDVLQEWLVNLCTAGLHCGTHGVLQRLTAAGRPILPASKILTGSGLGPGSGLTCGAGFAQEPWALQRNWLTGMLQ